MSQTTVNQRIKKWIESQDISFSDFENTTGYSQKNISNTVNDKVKIPKVDLIIAILKHYKDVNPYWLLLGEGQMIVDPPEVMRIEFDELKGLVHQLSAEFFKLKETLDQKKVNK